MYYLKILMFLILILSFSYSYVNYTTIYSLVLTNPYVRDTVKKYSDWFENKKITLHLDRYPYSINNIRDIYKQKYDNPDKVGIKPEEAGLGKKYSNVIVGVKIPAKIYGEGKTESCCFYFYSSMEYDLNFVFEYQGEIVYTSSIYSSKDVVSTYLSHMGATGIYSTRRYYSTYDSIYFFKGFLIGIYATISNSSYIIWNSKQEIDEKYESAIKNMLMILGLLNK